MDGSNKMIEVFVLFISTHGGMKPIMELPTEKACSLYQQHYERVFERAECHHLQRYDGHFRPPTHRKNNGSVSTQSSETFRPTA
jgi:hypothetical protein